MDFFEAYLCIYGHLGPYNYIWYKVYDVIDSPSSELGFAVHIFPVLSDDGCMDFQMYFCDQLNVKPWCSHKPSESCKSGQNQPGLQLHGLWWDRTSPMSPYGVTLTFLSGSALVSAGPLHTVSVVLCDIPYIELSPFTDFSREIYIEYFGTLVKVHIVKPDFSPY